MTCRPFVFFREEVHVPAHFQIRLLDLMSFWNCRSCLYSEINTLSDRQLAGVSALVVFSLDHVFCCSSTCSALSLISKESLPNLVSLRFLSFSRSLLVILSPARPG